MNKLQMSVWKQSSKHIFRDIRAANHFILVWAPYFQKLNFNHILSNKIIIYA